MARKARVEFEGAAYHLLDRGDRREAIFRDDADRVMFLTTLGQACERTGWRVHAFVLMSNHYHLLVETPQANLVAGMRWFQTTYTMRFNRRHRLCGHLFQGRYKSVIVNPEERGYFVTLSDYVHLNPVRAGMISLRERLFEYRWSSYPFYAARASRPAWFEADRVLGELGLEDNVFGRRCYAERMRERAIDELEGKNAKRYEQLRRGWYLGGPSFREHVLGLLDQAREKLSKGGEIDASIRRSHAEDEADRLFEIGLKHFGLNQGDLPSLQRSDGRKIAIARLIRSRTSVPNRWIAHRLALGHVSSIGRYCSNKTGPDELERQLRLVIHE